MSIAEHDQRDGWTAKAEPPTLTTEERVLRFEVLVEQIAGRVDRATDLPQQMGKLDPTHDSDVDLVLSLRSEYEEIIKANEADVAELEALGFSYFAREYREGLSSAPQPQTDSRRRRLAKLLKRGKQ